MSEVRRHLEAALAAEAALLRASRQGVRHLRPQRLVELAEGGADAASDEERRHLETCAACHAELEWARRQPPIETILPGDPLSDRPR